MPDPSTAVGHSCVLSILLSPSSVSHACEVTLGRATTQLGKGNQQRLWRYWKEKISLSNPPQ